MAAVINTDRALALLGQGLPAVQVAAAVGCTESYISQLISQPEFAASLASLRYEALQSATARDSKYDAIEDRLLAQLDRSVAMLVKPMEITRVLSIINAAKRRGCAAPIDATTQPSTQVTLILSQHSVKNFTVNTNNQVVSSGTQNLITATLGAVDSLAKEQKQ